MKSSLFVFTLIFCVILVFSKTCTACWLKSARCIDCAKLTRDEIDEYNRDSLNQQSLTNNIKIKQNKNKNKLIDMNAGDEELTDEQLERIRKSNFTIRATKNKGTKRNARQLEVFRNDGLNFICSSTHCMFAEMLVLYNSMCTNTHIVYVYSSVCVIYVY